MEDQKIDLAEAAYKDPSYADLHVLCDDRNWEVCKLVLRSRSEWFKVRIDSAVKQVSQYKDFQ